MPTAKWAFCTGDRSAKVIASLTRLVGDVGLNLNRADMLKAALEAQKSFWKFVGIVAAITIALYIVGILVAVLFATVWR